MHTLAPVSFVVALGCVVVRHSCCAALRCRRSLAAWLLVHPTSSCLPDQLSFSCYTCLGTHAAPPLSLAASSPSPITMRCCARPAARLPAVLVLRGLLRLPARLHHQGVQLLARAVVQRGKLGNHRWVLFGWVCWWSQWPLHNKAVSVCVAKRALLQRGERSMLRTCCARGAHDARAANSCVCSIPCIAPPQATATRRQTRSATCCSLE